METYPEFRNRFDENHLDSSSSNESTYTSSKQSDHIRGSQKSQSIPEGPLERGIQEGGVTDTRP